MGDDVLELGNIKGLDQEIEGAELHRLDGRLGGAVAGHEDDEQLGIHLADAAQRFQPRKARHAHVHNDQIGLNFGNKPQALLAAGSGGQLDFRRTKDPLERVLHVRLVVN